MKKSILIFLSSLLFTLTISAQIAFVENPNLAFLDDSSYLRGISWVDVDGDNDLDVTVTGAGGTFPDFVNVTSVFINQGNDVFENTGLVQSTQKNPFGHGWADVENDGDLDLYIGATWNNTGINELWVNENGTAFNQVANSGATPNTALPYEGSVSWGDFDNDGLVDLYLARWNNAANIFYKNNGNLNFSPITSGAITTDAAWTSAGLWGDFDNDLDLDLYAVNYQIGSSPGANFLYENNGNGTFTKLTGAGAVITDAQNSRSANWVDANNDGLLDLFVANQSDVDKLYLNQGNGVFASQNVSGAVTSWSSNWGDYDNDGDQDLFTMGFFGTDSRFYKNDGAGNLIDVTNDFPNIFPLETNGSNSNGVAFVDYDLDGWPDLHLTQPNTSSDRFFKNLGDGCGAWLEMELIGTVSNTAAIGATVRAKAIINGSPVWQMRQVSAQTSKPNTNPLWQHFGFADAEVVDSLLVEWPSGIECVFENVPLNQLVEIEEGCQITFITGLGNAGDDTLIEWCDGQSPPDLFPLLNGSPDVGGQWMDSQFEPVDVAPFQPGMDTSVLFYLQSYGACADTAEVTVIISPSPMLSFSPDTTVEQGSEVQLNASGATTYLWQPSDSLSCADCPNPVFHADTSTVFTVYAATSANCVDSAQVAVEVAAPEPDFGFEFPTVFTPNGDGVNDVFNAISQEDIFEKHHLRVFNRWGELVFESNADRQTWNGEHENEPAASDVYIYHFDFRLTNGKVGTEKGDVTLLR